MSQDNLIQENLNDESIEIDEQEYEENFNTENVVDEAKSTNDDIDNLVKNFDHKNENEILQIINSKSLSEGQIVSLLKLGKKDINIALAKSQKLSDKHIDILIENSVYMVISNIIKYQKLSDLNRKKLYEKISKMPMIYKEIINEFKDGQ